jgi:predicted nucleic acid-binding protein
MRLMDTDILIDVLRSHPPAIQWPSSQSVFPMTTGVSAMELWRGCTNKTQVSAVNELLRDLTVIWPTEADLQRAFDHFSSRWLSHNLGILDSYIGVCAVGRGFILCTFNMKHFQAIHGLQMEQPYAR